MENLETIIASIIAGLFALASGFLAWKLKSVTDNRQEENNKQKEKEALYREIFECFESAIRSVKKRDHPNIEERFLELNSKVNLHAPENILDKYNEAAAVLEEWSALFVKASPRTMNVDGQKVVMIQAPDPTKKYKEPEKEAYESLQEQLRSLMRLMKRDINLT